MTIAQMKKRYGGSGVAVCVPAMTDAGTGFVKSWRVLQIAGSLQDAAKAVDYYESEGFTGVVPVSMTPDIEITESLAAKYFRTAWGGGGSNGVK